MNLLIESEIISDGMTFGAGKTDTAEVVIRLENVSVEYRAPREQIRSNDFSGPGRQQKRRGNNAVIRQHHQHTNHDRHAPCGDYRKRQQVGLALGVPDPAGAVEKPGYNAIAVRAEARRKCKAVVAGKARELLPALGVPDS